MFKQVPDYPFAEVNIKGEVRSSHTKNILTPHLAKDGYYVYKVWCPLEKKGKRLSAHRAIAKTFIPNPENKPCVNHKDSNRVNNSLDNLEWVTVAENNQHGMDVGFIVIGKYGEDNTNNKLSCESVHEVCRLLEKGYTQVRVSEETGVNINTVFSIRSYDIWKSIVDLYDIPPVKKNLTEDVVVCICEDIKLGLTDKDINTKYNLGRGTLRHIKTGKTFKNVTKTYNLG